MAQSEKRDKNTSSSDRDQMAKPQPPRESGKLWTTHRVTEISMEVDENIGDPSNIAVKLVVTNEDDRSQSQINHSIIEFEEEDVSTDKHQIPQLPANTRSRSMLSLARTKMMSLVQCEVERDSGSLCDQHVQHCPLTAALRGGDGHLAAVRKRGEV